MELTVKFCQFITSYYVLVVACNFCVEYFTQDIIESAATFYNNITHCVQSGIGWQ